MDIFKRMLILNANLYILNSYKNTICNKITREKNILYILLLQHFNWLTMLRSSGLKELIKKKKRLIEIIYRLVNDKLIKITIIIYLLFN